MFQRIRRFFSWRRVFVLEIFPTHIYATLFKFQQGEKFIKPIGSFFSESILDPTALSDEIRKSFKKLVKFRPSKVQCVLSVDSSYATTVHMPISLIRDTPHTHIDETDLHNKVAQGIWRLFDKQRGLVAAKMNIRDVDVVLTDASVGNIKIDGHRVVNPMGFPARSIEVHFTQTFMPKQFLSYLKDAFPKVGLTVERGVTVVDILRRSISSTGFLLAELSENSTSFFFYDGSAISHIETIRWGTRSFLDALCKSFAVSEYVADEMLNRYLLGSLSSRMQKEFEEIFVNESSLFGSSLKDFLQKYNLSTVYVIGSSGDSLPSFIFGGFFKSKIAGKVNILPADIKSVVEKLGFDVDFDAKMDLPHLFSSLSALIEFYFINQNDRINKVARRHAHWLA
ncbi:MAG: hypothetical protein COU07_02045 [Candidatus Harrisonbacteria bacterium CG10_big_fil_rev_8_21_14_0_10_40_38]|uniref:SHS2 domain-containing protein n=1 Tax=Candidatus Harrisonbacteria bacterium CG10_big_fil_rev_8_21_14_0_10_40_38 TaxID=1974583 RepID=A0A2H0US73_9BACT|nr:MAG: hypothetical protein COU07_02045 [Candidatus Harrisonbacteria bacterium CG10_big_fil_rev_8_21_14_0_10_40_38]